MWKRFAIATSSATAILLFVGHFADLLRQRVSIASQ